MRAIGDDDLLLNEHDKAQPGGDAAEPMTTSPAAVRLALGQSLAIDLLHCDRARIADRDIVQYVLINAAKQSGAIDVFTCGSSVDLPLATRLMKEGFHAQSAAVSHHLERGTVKPPTPADQLTVLISVHGCRNQSESAARIFLESVRPRESRFVRGGFSLLDENLSLGPPMLAALRAFDGESFSFHTGL